jgi:hypothetical protein
MSSRAMFDIYTAFIQWRFEMLVMTKLVKKFRVELFGSRNFTY